MTCNELHQCRTKNDWSILASVVIGIFAKKHKSHKIDEITMCLNLKKYNTESEYVSLLYKHAYFNSVSLHHPHHHHKVCVYFDTDFH